MNQELLDHIEEVHTTPLGVERIRRNLSLENDDVVAWCKNSIVSKDAEISRKGKNWYVHVKDCVITINAHSYTIITAHKEKNHNINFI